MSDEKNRPSGTEWERDEQERLPPRGTGTQDNQGDARRNPDDTRAEEDAVVSTGAGGRTTRGRRKEKQS